MEGCETTPIGSRRQEKKSHVGSNSSNGDYNHLHGHSEDDTLWVPPGFTGNTLDGGPHISSDTCGDCFFSSCSNCP